MTTKKSIGKQYERMRGSLLDVIVDNFDYFREHKSHLAWALMKFDLVHMGGRVAYDACQDNINESYRRAAENILKKDESLFSDAWDLVQTCNEHGTYRDDFDPEHPISQAMLDYYARMREILPKDAHPTDEELVERASYESCGTPSAELAGYTKAQRYLRKDIKDKILAITKDHIVAQAISQYKVWGRKIREKEREKDRLTRELLAAGKKGDYAKVIELSTKLLGRLK